MSAATSRHTQSVSGEFQPRRDGDGEPSSSVFAARRAFLETIRAAAGTADNPARRLLDALAALCERADADRPAAIAKLLETRYPRLNAEWVHLAALQTVRAWASASDPENPRDPGGQAFAREARRARCWVYVATEREPELGCPLPPFAFDAAPWVPACESRHTYRARVLRACERRMAGYLDAAEGVAWSGGPHHERSPRAAHVEWAMQRVVLGQTYPRIAGSRLAASTDPRDGAQQVRERVQAVLQFVGLPLCSD
jgi:hypothetical protein